LPTEDASRHRPGVDDVPGFVEMVEGHLLFEPAMMNLAVNRVDEPEINAVRQILDEILNAATWHDFKERIYALNSGRCRVMTQSGQMGLSSGGICPLTPPGV
jgi:hypothetical protein